MSNPTELPDLDRLDPCPFCGGPARFESSAMWIDLICNHDKACILDGDTAEMSYQHAAGSREAMAAKWNRRAKPEGEAPQAEPVPLDVEFKQLADTILQVTTNGARLEALRSMAALFDEQAAQHAESGAQAAECPTLPFTNYNGHSDGSEPLWTKEQMHEYARAALAAQSQGAQALPGRVKSATPGMGIIEIELAADLPEWLDPGYPVHVSSGAQQAAAPGALTLLNAEEMAALHRFQETCQDFDSGGYDVDKNMMKRLASIGVIESKGFSRYQFTEFGDYVVEHYAPSAPGTPEAPDEDLKGGALWHATLRACGELPEGYEVRIELENGCGMAVWYDAEGERHVIDGEGYLSDDVNEAVDAAIQRAAQLDGGQEVKHG